MTEFVSVLNQIEEKLTERIDVGDLAKSARMSVYEFRRIFSFVIGVPLSEYIRKRRLSVAAEELLNGDISVTEAAMKYQYEDSSSFARAFKDFHGVSPSEVAKGAPVKMYTKVNFSLKIEGGSNVEYRVYKEKEYYIEGVRGFSKIEEKECCEKVWEAFENSPRYEELLADGKVYAGYENGDAGVRCYIGRRRETAPANGECLKIPSGTWVAFNLRRTDDEFVNGYYGDVICKWLRSSRYRRDENRPNVEIFPADMSEEGFPWEIHIPVRFK